jgi:hypothetical protein
MDINEIKTFVTENADKEDVKAFISEFNQVTPEKFESYITTTEEGKKVFESKVDSRVSQAAKTVEARLQKELEQKYKNQLSEEISKMNKAETPAEREAREAKQMVNEERNARITSELRSSVLDYAYNSDLKNIGVVFADVVKDLVDVKKAENGGKLLEYLERIGKSYKDDVQEAIKKIKGNNASTPNGGDNTIEPNTLESWNRLMDECNPATWQAIWSQKYYAWCNRRGNKK